MITTTTKPEAKGLECPRCGCCHFLTADTVRLAGRIRRYRACRHCGRRIVTVEAVEAKPPKAARRRE